MQLVLFDIDGTLIRSNQVGSRAIRRTLTPFVGHDRCLDGVTLAGMCDWGIWRAALANEGYSADESDAHLPELFRQYVAALAQILADESQPSPEVLPGVRPLLETLHARDDVLLGLLTGNVEAAAWLKLGAVGLDHFFRFGAFGNDAPERAALPALAVERAAPFAGGHLFRGEAITIIGDTEHDVRCGASLGVRAVGVATGSQPAATLRAAGAALVLDSLAEQERLLRLLFP